MDDTLHFALCNPLREPPRKALSGADFSLRSSQFCHPPDACIKGVLKIKNIHLCG